MTRAELVEAMARAIYEKRNGFGCKAWARLPQLHHAPYKQDASAALAAIEAAGLIPVQRKLLAEAHACMRATGWHLAVDAPDTASDGVLETACSDVEARMRAVLSQEPGR